MAVCNVATGIDSPSCGNGYAPCKDPSRASGGPTAGSQANRETEEGRNGVLERLHADPVGAPPFSPGGQPWTATHGRCAMLIWSKRSPKGNGGAVPRQIRSDAFDASFRPGSTEEALRAGPRQYFALAAELARGQFDPTAQWGEFVSALWEQVDACFDLTADEEDLEATLAWFEEPGDADVVVWNPRGDGG